MDLLEEDVDFKQFLNEFDLQLRRGAEEVNGHITEVLSSLGSSTAKYSRERGKALRAVVSELYSPARVAATAKLCPSYGIMPGFSLDLTTCDSDGRPWDFDDPEMRDRAWAKVVAEKPLFVIGPPMCTAFSTWQYI